MFFLAVASSGEVAEDDKRVAVDFRLDKMGEKALVEWNTARRKSPTEKERDILDGLCEVKEVAEDFLWLWPREME